jgi:hypothetical protein
MWIEYLLELDTIPDARETVVSTAQYHSAHKEVWMESQRSALNGSNQGRLLE